MNSNFRVVLISSICFFSGLSIGYVFKMDSSLKESDQRLKAWRTEQAAFDLISLGKLRTHIQNNDINSSKKLISEWIMESQSTINFYKTDLSRPEKFYIQNAESILGSGQTFSESHAPEKTAPSGEDAQSQINP
jgi:hypothetical protein